MASPPDDVTARIRGAAALDPVIVPIARLAVTAGPDAGASFNLHESPSSRVLVGQSPVCHVKLTDKTVSRRHLAIDMDAQRIRVIDLESRNGTAINGVLIKEASIRGGEEIVLGNTTMVLSREAPLEISTSRATAFGKVLGASPVMRRLYAMLERIAPSELPVLIEGETGTGKEAVAEAIHEASARHDQPFVIFDCTTVSPQLLEAELFGHERGAFTGAVRDRAGPFEQADKGTLLIDEIGDLDISLQAKLLRAIERGEVRRVGANDWRKVDVRILAATRRDLDQEVTARRFRDDLFFRLAVARIELPPLRERSGDITLLARCFWTMLGGDDAKLPPSVLQQFERYSWPGNVRELYNAVARQRALGEWESDAGTEAPPWSGMLERLIRERVPLPVARQEVTAALEREYVTQMLEACGGDHAAAAAACGIGRRYFQMLRAKL